MKRLPTYKPHLRNQIRSGGKTETRRTRGLSRVNEDPDAWTMTHEWRGRRQGPGITAILDDAPEEF